jgi:hypothetical protein
VTDPTETPTGAAPPDPKQILGSRGYMGLLVMGALVGAPVAFVAYCPKTWVSTRRRCGGRSCP